jgi:arsenate reductase (thioredoxin)
VATRLTSGGKKTSLTMGIQNIIRRSGILAGSIAICILPTQMWLAVKTQSAVKSGNSLVTALWFSHLYADPQALLPSKDRQLKTTLSEALRAKKAGLSWNLVSEVFEKRVFQNLASADDYVTLLEMERMLHEKTPRSREDIYSKVRLHADLLTTQFDLIEERHRAAADELVTWISTNYQPGKPLAVIVVCTGNSRRSILGSTMGNIAAAYYGLPDIRFYSGGTTPSAFNPRTVETLKEIGVVVEPTGKEGPRGSSGEANPIYKVLWRASHETLEFSKVYSDAHNPQSGFAAVMVCSQADAECPVVKGAGKRISAPYADPKEYDGAEFEAAKYAERRDDIGRFMLSVLMQARRRLELDNKLK